MRRYQITSPAQQDLDDVYEHVAADSLTAAGRLLERFTETFWKLADLPGMGRRREELGSGLRSVSVAPYLIFYREIPDGVEIVRVLHGARDLPTLFSDAEPGAN